VEWQRYRLRQRGGAATLGASGRPLSGERFPCAYCGGTGAQAHMRSRCPVCGGKGFNTVGGPAVVCAFCLGAGEAPPRSHLTCPACRGKGVMAVEQPFEECDLCRGTGRSTAALLPCSKCKGAGVFATNRRV